MLVVCSRNSNTRKLLERKRRYNRAHATPIRTTLYNVFVKKKKKENSTLPNAGYLFTSPLLNPVKKLDPGTSSANIEDGPETSNLTAGRGVWVGKRKRLDKDPGVYFMDVLGNQDKHPSSKALRKIT